MNKGKPSGNPFNFAKIQEFEFIPSRHFKNLISPKPADSNSFEKFKAIASRPILCPYFRFFLQKRLLKKSIKPGHGNLELLTSSVPFELYYGYSVLLTYYGFSRLLCHDDARQN